MPDVEANASPNSGYPLTVGGFPAADNGTSAAAPLYAGLVAILNAALGEPVGFLNPTLYALNSAVCRDVNPYAANPPAGPVNNSLNAVTGNPAGPGWDACTGWGSIDGTALLTALQQGSQKDCYFILDWFTFVKPGIAETLSQPSTNPAVFQAAFYVVAEWFTPSDLGIGTASPQRPSYPPAPRQTN